MQGPKLLLDTNVLIGLEDNREIDVLFSHLQQSCQKFGLTMYVHEASRDDIARDKNDPRKAVILSKIPKFQPLEGIPTPSAEEMAAQFGPIRKPNDLVDVILLYSVCVANAADFLITQDRGLHRRAIATGFGDRVFTVEDALAWIAQQYERISVPLPYILERQCHQIDRQAKIFESLATDYEGFADWFLGCVKQHRDCWVVYSNEKLAGIAIRKDEDYGELAKKIDASNLLIQPQKILKICTFKIAEGHRGEKLGEQLLKQVLWWASRNRYDLVYLTVFPKHEQLVDLIAQFGFVVIGERDGEKIMAKAFESGVLAADASEDPLEYHRQYYPSFMDHDGVNKWIVPIKAPYYRTLFPENERKRQSTLLDLFVAPTGESRIPGNTIRKVYVCRTPTKSIKKGDLLLFYIVQDGESFDSQSVVTIGVVDGFAVTKQADEIMRLTTKRSVFSADELEAFAAATQGAKVINFLLASHLDPSLPYKTMTDAAIAGPYQSIRSIPADQYHAIQHHMRPHD